MKRSILVVLILLAVAAAVGGAWLALDRGFGGGEYIADRRDLPPFTRIVVDGLADVTLVQGAREEIVVEAPKRQHGRVRVDVDGETLSIAAGESRRWWSGLFGGSSRPTRLTVTFRDLDTLQATGAVKLRSDRLRAGKLAISAAGASSLKLSGLDIGELSVNGAGALKAELAGRATVQRVAVSGAGSYRAADLASERAAVTVSGAGRVVVNATKTLTVGLSGAGVVEYLGDPEVKQQVSGAGRVKKRDAAFEAGRRAA
jgi:hypothetical protein